jgi:hypothetical protein
MTGTMVVSVREVAVLARQIMLALELPSAAVIDAARLLAELEIQEQRGVCCMDRIRRTPELLAARSLKVLDESPSLTVLDADGGSGLVIGPTLLDLPSAQARLRGGGVLLCRNVTCLPVLPCLVEQGRRRGVSTLVAIAPAGGFEHEKPAPILARFASGTIEAADRARTDVADLHHLVETAIRTCCRQGDASAWATAAAGASGIVSHTVRWPPLSERGDIIVACAKPLKAGPATGATRRWPRNGGYDWIEMGEASVPPDQAEVRAMTQGIPVDRALWRELMDFSSGALVASSERSRRDAGPFSGSGASQWESIE